METKYLIKIGELYIDDIVVDSNNALTHFIKSIKLHADHGHEYSAETMISTRRILLEIGIDEESITVIRVGEEDE